MIEAVDNFDISTFIKLTNNTKDAVLALSSDHTIIAANKKAVHYFSKAQDIENRGMQEVFTKQVCDFIAEPDKHENNSQRVIIKDHLFILKFQRLKHGNQNHIIIYLSPIELCSSGISNCQTMFHTITSESQAPVIIVNAESEKVEYVNVPFTALLDSDKKILGKKISEETIPIKISTDKNKPIEFHDIPLNKALRGKVINQKKIQVTSPHGLSSFFMADAIPIRNSSDKIVAALMVLQDITEKEKTKHELDNTKSLLKTVMQQSPIPMTIASLPDMNIKFINKACGQLLNIDNVKEHIGKPLDEFKKDWQELDENNKVVSDSEQPLSLALKGIKSTKEYKLIRNDGSIRYELVHGVPVYNSKNELIAGYILYLDITNRKKTEFDLQLRNEEIKAQNEEFRALNEELRDGNEKILKINKKLKVAKVQAQESDRLKTAFLANMSHEIRTPINGIMGFTELLEDEDISEQEHTDFLTHIKQCSNQLLTLIDDIIDIAKIEASQLRIEKRNCNVDHLLESVLQFYENEKALYNKESIKIQLEIPDTSSSFTMHTDEFRLRQIFNNLINNSLKFTDEGFIQFGYSFIKKGGKDLVKFFVKDSGRGISEDMHKKIFNRFIQEKHSADPQSKGTGLGLAICKGIVELLGGEIWIEKSEKGTHFCFTLAAENASNIDVIPTIAKGKPTIDLTGKTILVTEDTPENFKYLQTVLKKFNANILWEQNGEEAVKTCMKNNQIDLVLMDMRMPKLSGYEATKLIKSIKKELPIVAQTANAMTGDKTKSINAGCDDYIAKPINRNELMQILSKFLL